MRCLHGVAVRPLGLLCALLAPAVLGLVAASQPQGPDIARTALFQHGQVLTTRSLERAREGRSLAQEDAADVFVLGVPHDTPTAREVQRSLQRTGGQVLHAVPEGRGRRSAGLPGEHWLIRASPQAVASLLERHPEATAGRLPTHFKVSPHLELALQRRANGARDAAHGAGEAAGPVSLLVLAPKCERAEQQQLVAELRETYGPLTAAVGPDCGLSAKLLTGALQLSVCRAVAVSVTQWLTRRPEVTWLEEVLPKRKVNLHAGAYVQSPQRMQTAVPPELRQGANGPFFPLWTAGLDGRDQVVGLVDTGLDMDSCYLWDTRFRNYNRTATRLVTIAGDTVPAFVNATHRKVAAYVFYADRVENDGHGTHTGASIVGSAAGFDPTRQPDLATGIAPRARLALLDVSNSTDGDLFIPSDPHDVYGFLRDQVGARVMSNSWTQTTTAARSYFSAVCSLYDEYLLQKQDTLIVFAAGNDGEDTSALTTTGTTLAPATCKNVLSVGASENWLDRGLEQIVENMLNGSSRRANLSTAGYVGPWSFGSLLFQYRNQSLQLDSDNVDFTTMQGVDARLVKLGNRTFALRMASPPDACDPLTANHSGSSVPVLVLVRQTTQLIFQRCFSRVSARNVARSGAAGAIIYWDDTEYPRLALAQGQVPSSFPVAVLRAQPGRILESVLLAGVGVTVRWRPQRRPRALPPEHVAIFSSYASAANLTTDPTADVRFKPDLVAPGYLRSAHSTGGYSGKIDQCSTTVMSGTSMSAPLVAGAAALVRQYFTKGYYPSGAAVAADAYQPTAALLKALLIAGASAMRGFSRTNDAPLAPPPNQFEGFGRLDLSNVLPLKGLPAAGWKLQVVDKASLSAAGRLDRYTFTVSNASAAKGLPLSVALTWLDPPPFTGSVGVLVNDLDLSVSGPRTPPRAVQPGAARSPPPPPPPPPSGPTLYWGNGVAGGDRRNNVEKVFIARPGAGQWVVTVQARVVSALAAPQRYALVVAGAVDTVITSQFNPATRR